MNINLYRNFKATCLAGDKKLAEDDASTGYQNGIPCKCAKWTPATPIGQCVDNKQTYTKTCDKEPEVIFVDPEKNECEGEATEIGECGEFEFGEWVWLYCSENCGLGEEIGTRTCKQLGEIPCPEPGSCNEEATCVYQTRPCQIQKCLTCANYANYCDNRINTQCVDIILENGETTVR